MWLVVMLVLMVVGAWALSTLLTGGKSGEQLREEAEEKLNAVRRRNAMEEEAEKRSWLKHQAALKDMAVLLNAAGAGDWELVSIGLNGGFPVNTGDEDGWTLLHAAARAGQADTVGRLLELGADADVRANDGRTPSDFAASNGHQKLAALLANRRALGS
jgi:hypothetical protein